jgi:predicted dehydrogenase
MTDHPIENQLSRKERPHGTRSDSRLKVAVVGVGRMGRHHLTAVMRLQQYAVLVGVADADTSSAKLVGEEVGAPWFDDVASLLEAVRPDIVHVCTTPSEHFPVARAALMAGAHVYVEKPFTESAGETRELLTVAAEHERQVCAGHQLLLEAPTLRAQQLLPRIGRIQHVESYFAFQQATRQDGRPPLTPEAQLMDILPHPVCLLVHFLELAAPKTPLSISAVRAYRRGVAHILCEAGEATGSLTATLCGRRDFRSDRCEC